MALNPFFLNGSSSEQNLVQDLINEQLRMYGLDVYYIPRKMLQTDNILNEVQSSKFDDNFIIEAYVNSYEGYTGQGDIMTKFGVSLKDEVNLIISKERFEEFIAPIMAAIHDVLLEHNPADEVLVTRPREGDLIYFPLGERLFEVKFVEHEKPFYQLGKLYVYELQCELFEYEDEIIDTSIYEIDEDLADEGYITTLTLRTADEVQVTKLYPMKTLDSGYVQKLSLNDDGGGYIYPPIVSISTSPVGIATANAEAIAITTSSGGVYSVLELLLTRPGWGYIEPPTVTIVGGGGAGAAATAVLGIGSDGIGEVRINADYPGKGYNQAPNVAAVGSGTSDVNVVTFITAGIVTVTALRDAGAGYTTLPTFTVEGPISANGSQVGVGTYQFNEIVIGAASSTKARVKDWDINTMKLKVGIATGDFLPGEDIVGQESGARYNAQSYQEYDLNSPFAKNDEFENEGIDILDFSEDNPFGTF
jgi:hypothetical protein